MKFPKLYSKSLTGKILEWTIEVEGDSYRTIAGQQDGKKVTSEWSKCEAKNVGRSNATTGEEQAKLEAEALWKKKIKSHGYWEKVEDVDGSKFIEPMLAKKLIDRENKVDFSKGIIVQIKLNGLRCVATKDGLFSRKGERFISVPHIENDLKEWFKTNPNAVLDGELFNYDYRQCLNEIVKLCRKTKDVNQEDLDRSEKLVKYYVYDGYGFDGMNEFVPYQKRKLYIDTNLPKFTKFYGPVKDFFVTSRTELDKIFESFLQDGQEGAMVRIPDSPYEHKRSNNLLKHKPIEDAEFKILDILPGTGNWAGKARVIKLKDGNDTFKADFKGSMEEAREMFDNKSQYIGKTVRIFFFGKTGLGTPNYAKFDYDNWKLQVLNIDEFEKNLIVDENLRFRGGDHKTMGRYIRSILTKEVLYYFIVRQDMSSNSIAKKLVKLKIGAGMIILLAKEYGIETKSIRESNSTEDVKKKRSNTLKSRYGIDHQLQKESPFYLKRNQTVKDKYGVENVFQLEDVKKKSLNSMVERHGVKSSRNVPWYKPNNGKRSKSHQEIEKILTDLNVSFESEYGQKKEHKHFTKYNDYLKREYSPVVDILVPNKNTVIEIYDDNFHANPNLHKDEELIKRWGGVFTAKEIRDFDKSRKEQLESLGYKVIEIWRSDIRKNKKQVIANIKSFLELS